MLSEILKRKLNSNEGASLMVALLFFVMCATVGSIILAAASASSGRLANLVKEDQTYYTTSSAADVLGKVVSDKANNTLVITMDVKDGSASAETDTIKVNNTAEGVYTKQFIPDQIYVALSANTAFRIADLDRLFTHSTVNTKFIETRKLKSTDLYYSKTNAFSTKAFSIDGNEHKELGAHADFYLTKDLDIILCLYPYKASEIESSAADNPPREDLSNLILWFKAVKKTDSSLKTPATETNPAVFEKTYTICWEKPEIYKGKLSVES